MKARYGCWLFLWVMLLGAVAPSWGQETGAKAEAVMQSAAMPAPAPVVSASPAAPAYEEKDRTVFFIIGGLINVLALVVFIFWALRQARQKDRRD